jgi:transposase
MENCKIDTYVSLNKLKFADAVLPQMISLGIDVAKDSLTVCELFSDGKKKFREIMNAETSLKRLATRLIKNNFKGKIIMESTGRHHMIGAIVLSENNLDVRLINPLISKKYATASIRKIKTDKRDSEILAEIGIKEDALPPTFKLTRKDLRLRKKMRLIYSVSKQLQNLNTSMREHKKTLDGIKQKLSPMEKQIMDTIKLLKKQKEQLEQELENDVYESEHQTKKAKRYDSIPGISSYVAGLAALIFSDKHSQSAKQWVAFVGMDVSVRQSGKWTGQGHLTKRGNNYLRMRFFSAAWGAVMHDDRFRKYYDHLRIVKNRKHKEALIIIARKIINIMFSLNKHGSMYNDSKPLFQPV